MNHSENPDLDRAIISYSSGNATTEEEKILYQWIKEDPENRKKLFRDKDLWDSLLLNSPSLKKIQQELWDGVEGKISPEEKKQTRISFLLRMVAAVIVSVCAGWFGHQYFLTVGMKNKDMAEHSVSAYPGQVKEIFLPDGTHVWLNSDSRLTFPSSFSINHRQVSLSGEAYFEVAADTKHPFLVKTGNHLVKVTGTRFNICEYPENKIIETTLEEGKVKIISGNIFKDLLPGQQSSFSTETAEIRISETDFEIYTSWKEGRYTFKNEPVAKVFQIIERWWDVKIDYPEDIKDERISGVLRRYKPVEQHFEVIRQLIPLSYRITDDLITIEMKK